MPLQFQRLRYIRKMLRALQPDLAISFLTKINLLSLLAVPERRFPVIASERNNPRVQGNNWLWKHLNAIALGRADRIVMLTQEARASLPDKLRAKAEVIYVPCETQPGITYRNHGKKRVVGVGRLDPQKGFDLLITAFARVLDTHPDASLTIFGEGYERPRLEGMIRDLELQDAIRLPSVTERSGAWLEAGEVFAFSSRYEGFGNALAEATVGGMPSISFDCDFGPREIIEDGKTGLLVPAGDVGAMADAITSLLSDPRRQMQLSEAGRDINGARFAPATILSQWDNVIETARRR